MTFLEICQRVHDLVGFQGRFTSVDATGYQAVLVQAVKDAYDDVQRYRKDWNWLKDHRSINVDNSKTTYTTKDLWGNDTPDFAEYRHINWYDTSGTQDRKFRLIYVPYDAFMLMKFSEPHQPRYWTSEPWSKSLLISPVDQLYTLDLHYTRTLDPLVNNGDTPDIPERHQMMIVYGAVMKLSTFVGNPTLFDTYSFKYSEGMGQLLREENPAKTVRKRPVV